MLPRFSNLKAASAWFDRCIGRSVYLHKNPCNLLPSFEVVRWWEIGRPDPPTFRNDWLNCGVAASPSCRSCTTVGLGAAMQTSFSKMAVEVGGTLKINLLGVDAEVNVTAGESLEEIQLKAWWKESLGMTNENAFDIVSHNNLVSLKMQLTDMKPPVLSKLGAIIPGRWCNLLLEAGKRHVEIQNLREGSLIVKTTGGDITLGELRGSKAFIESNGGFFIAGLVSAISEVYTGGGNISVKKALGTTMTMDSGGGDMVIGFVYGDDVRLSSRGGQMEVKHLQAQNMAHISSDGGHIKIDGLDGKIEIFSGGGNVQVQLLTNAKEVKIDAGVGDVTLYLTPQLYAEVEHFGTGKFVQEDVMQESHGLPCFHSADSDLETRSLETRQRTSKLSCRVHISGSGNVVTRRRSWLEAFMNKTP